MEQPFGAGRDAQHLRAHTARALPHQGHIARIAAKGRDVVPYPPQGRQLIVDPVVARMSAFPHAVGSTEESAT